MKNILLILLLITSINLFCQNRYSNYSTSSYQPNYQPTYQTYNSSKKISCQDLFNFITEKGYKKSTISSYTLQSSLLTKVTAYEYDYQIYVVAEIKRNEYSYQSDSYIFCGIPSNNWRNFQYGGYGDSNSYGERFHQYIFDYKCDCQ